jgi:hydrogenase expression/formation protein HypC
MCLGIPGQVIEFVDEAHDIARLDVNGVRRNINVSLLMPDGLQVGDWVLVHVGFALSKIDEEEAKRTLSYLETLGQVFNAELDEIKTSRIE